MRCLLSLLSVLLGLHLCACLGACFVVWPGLKAIGSIFALRPQLSCLAAEARPL